MTGCDPDHEELVSCVAADRAGQAFFGGLDDSDLADLQGRFVMAAFGKGELIYSPFDRGDELFLVEGGRVRVYRSAPDGRQVTLVMLDPGGWFGQMLVPEETMYSAYAEAMTDCVVGVLGVPDLEGAIRKHPRVALNLAGLLAQRLRTVEDQVESVAFRSVPSRLAGQLLDLTDRYGRVASDGIWIDEHFTHVQLAEMIATTRETVTKALSDLRDAGLVDVRERRLGVLDADGLERLKTAD